MEQMERAIKVRLGEALKFQVDIQGTSTPVSEARFTIKIGDKKMSYVGEIKNGVVIFELLDLPKIINVGQQYACELELFIGNQYFVPFMAVFEFIEPMEIKASLMNGNFVKKNETEQEVPKIAVKMEKAVSENLKKIDSIDSSKLKKSGKNKRMRFVVLR